MEIRAFLVALLLLTTHTVLAIAAGPSVIIVGAGFSGISAAKTLSDAGIKDFLILEATDHIGGRIHKTNFAGINVEKGANWVEGVNGTEVNPIWVMANELDLRRFYSDYDNVSSNTYKQEGGLYGSSEVEKAIEESESIHSDGEKLSVRLPQSGRSDISILTMQRLKNQ